MKRTTETYKSPKTRQHLEALADKKPLLVTDEQNDKLDLKQARTLKRSRKRTVRTMPQQRNRKPQVGLFGVNSLEGLAELAAMKHDQDKILELTGITTRQGICQALQDTSEILTRAELPDGTRVSRHVQNIISTINKEKDPVVALAKFLLFLMPIEHRALGSRLISIYLQIPLDRMVKFREAAADV